MGWSCSKNGRGRFAWETDVPATWRTVMNVGRLRAMWVDEVGRIWRRWEQVAGGQQPWSGIGGGSFDGGRDCLCVVMPTTATMMMTVWRYLFTCVTGKTMGLSESLQDLKFRCSTVAFISFVFAKHLNFVTCWYSNYVRRSLSRAAEPVSTVFWTRGRRPLKAAERKFSWYF